MTGTTLIARVRDKLDDSSYSASKIMDAGSDFISEICSKYKFGFMETTATINVADDATTATLPSDLLTILAMRLTSPHYRDMMRDQMEYTDFMDTYPNWDTTDAMTIFKWTIFANQIRFAAPVDGAHTIKVDYLKEPTRVTEAASEYILPELYDELLVLGALLRVMKDNEDYQEAEQREVDLSRLMNNLILREGRAGRVAGARSTMFRKRGGLNPKREW